MGDAREETWPLDPAVARLVPPQTPARGPWDFHSFLRPEGAATSAVSWHPPREHAGPADGEERTHPGDLLDALARGWCPDLHGHRDWMGLYGVAPDAEGRLTRHGCVLSGGP